MHLSDRVKLARDEAGLSQAELAHKVGVTKSAVSGWETGAIKNLKNKTLFAVARHTKTSAKWLATGKGPKSPPAGLDQQRAHYYALIDEMSPEQLESLGLILDAMAGLSGRGDTDRQPHQDKHNKGPAKGAL